MYLEITPAPDLRPWVACYWSRRGGSASQPPLPHFRVLPDGCVDLLFELSGGGGDLLARVVGTMTRALEVERLERLDFLGVRFRPGRARALLALPIDRLTNLAIDADELVGREVRRLADRLAAAPGLGDRAGLLDDFLHRRLDPARLHPATLAAADRIEARSGAVTVNELAAWLGISRQHLTRSFRAHVGIGPKMFARVARFQGALAAARGSGGWAEAAAAAGYSDQSHLVRDCRDLAGVPPTRLIG